MARTPRRGVASIMMTTTSFEPLLVAKRNAGCGPTGLSLHSTTRHVCFNLVRSAKSGSHSRKAWSDRSL
jgi:hypothetical protein